MLQVASIYCTAIISLFRVDPLSFKVRTFSYRHDGSLRGRELVKLGKRTFSERCRKRQCNKRGGLQESNERQTGNGKLEYDELLEALRVSVAENSLFLNREEVEELTEVLIDEIDIDGDGEVTFTELVTTLKEKYPDVLDNLSLSLSQWLKPPGVRNQGKLHPSCCGSGNSFRNNQSLIITLVIYFFINAGLFTISAVRYRSANGFLIVARGCGMALNFNCALVVVFVLRYTLTWLRSTRLGYYLPCDQNVRLHKLVGRVIAVLSAVHTIGHIGNIAFVVKPMDQLDPISNTTFPMSTSEKTREFFLLLFSLKSGIGWVTRGLAFPTGWALSAVLLVIVVFSMTFVRRRGNFQVFYWTHTLYIVFWALLVLHGPIFWYFFIVPGLIFLLEKIYTSPLARLAKYGKTYVISAKLLPSEVTHLEIARPSNFNYKPGDYVFIRIPDIASYEWHPFTISSAPERKDAIWLHIRKAGNWTGKLYEYLQNEGKMLQQCYINDVETGIGKVTENTLETKQIQLIRLNKMESRRSRKRRSTKSSVYKRKSSVVSFNSIKLRVEIGGPYGSPSRDIFDTEHAVLIASGIGVTPFASILQSIMNRHLATKKSCPRCQHHWYDDITGMKVLKVDFIWINRNQRCFEWFLELLADLEARQQEAGVEEFLNIHLYLTGLASQNEIKGLWLQLAVDALHSRRQRDALTGLKTRTNPGRPDWNKVFQQINANKNGKVKVFFCGAAALASTLKQTCDDFNFGFTKEIF